MCYVCESRVKTEGEKTPFLHVHYYVLYYSIDINVNNGSRLTQIHILKVDHRHNHLFILVLKFHRFITKQTKMV